MTPFFRVSALDVTFKAAGVTPYGVLATIAGCRPSQWGAAFLPQPLAARQRRRWRTRLPRAEVTQSEERRSPRAFPDTAPSWSLRRRTLPYFEAPFLAVPAGRDDHVTTDHLQ